MCVASHIFSPATQSTNDARVLEIKFSKLQVEIVSGARSALRVLRTTNIWQFSMTTSTTTSSNDVAKNRVTREAEKKTKTIAKKTTFYLFFLCERVCARCSFVSFGFRWKNENSAERNCVCARLILHGAVVLPASKSKENEWMLRPRPVSDWLLLQWRETETLDFFGIPILRLVIVVVVVVFFFSTFPSVI